MASCSIEGCGKPHEAKGYCNAHYLRVRRHGDPLGGGTPNGEPMRFINEVAMHHTGDECLIWPFANSKGYGKLWVDGKLAIVSRYVCELLNGPPPTPEHEAAHNCGKGHYGCIAPDHLEWKTSAGNNADKLIHGTINRGGRNGQAKLEEGEAREILAMKGIESQSKLAKRFGVSSGAIANIHADITWAWLSEEQKKDG